MERLTITVPFIYEADAKKDLQRTDREVFFAADVEIDLFTVNDHEAPVVAQWLEADRVSDAEEDRFDHEPRLIEVRVFEGQFYQRSDNHDKSWTNADIFTRNTGSNPFIQASSSHSLASIRMAWTAFQEGKVPTSEEGYRISTSKREQRQADVVSIADQFLLIEGAVWTKCGEPILCLNRKKDHQLHYAEYSVVFHSGGDPASNGPGSFYRLDEAEEMRAASKEHLAADQRKHMWEKEYFRELDVFIPEALKTNPDKYDYMRFAKRLLADDKDDLLDHGRDVTTAWHDLDEASSLVAEMGDDAAISSLLEAAANLIKLKAAKRTMYYRYQDDLAALQDRFDNRPVHLPTGSRSLTFGG